MNMTVLVTGSSGFVGAYFVTKSQEYSIKEVDLLTCKVADINFMGCDCVLHLAALVHQINNISREEYYAVNRDLAIEVAKHAKDQGVKHFIFMSTVKVYGESTSDLNPWDEDTPCKPLDNYGKSKLQAEILLQNMQNEFFKVAIIRSPLIYGPEVKANMLNLMKIVCKYPVLPFGGIHNKRSFVYIGNLIALIKQIINNTESGIFIPRDPESLSTTSLVKIMAKCTNKKKILLTIPKIFVGIIKLIRPSAVNRLWGSLELNNTKTNQKLKFNPPFSNEDGICAMIKWYMGNKGK